MKLRDASLQVYICKKLFQTSSFMYFAFIFSECITITSSEKGLKVCEYNFFQRNVILLVIYLFNRDSPKSTIYVLIRVPTVPFHFFDKLKYEIRTKVLIFVSILKLRYEK